MKAPSTDTRSNLKAVALKLFAERGVEAVTVREIVAMSGAKNGGSLNYYFSSKEGLIEELISDVFRESTKGWLEGLMRLEQSDGPKSVRDIIGVIVDPTRDRIEKSPFPCDARFLASLLFTRRHMVRDLMQQMNFSVFGHLLNYIKILRPDIPDEVMQQRLVFVSWYMVTILAAWEAACTAKKKKNTIWTATDPLETLKDSAAALLESPVTTPSMPAMAVAKTAQKRNTRAATAKTVISAAKQKAKPADHKGRKAL